MSVVAEQARPVPAVEHRPWWRGRIVQVAAVVGLMVLEAIAGAGD